MSKRAGFKIVQYNHEMVPESRRGGSSLTHLEVVQNLIFAG